MTRKLQFILGCLFVTAGAQAQTTSWVLQPTYDAITISPDGKYMLTDSAGCSRLYATDGTVLYTTPEKISPFSEGYAVIVKRGGDEITGFIDSQGKFTALEGASVANDFPYFKQGKLAYVKGGDYCYSDTSGQSEKPFTRLVHAYPFYNEYAPQYGYVPQMLKVKKVPCYFYLNSVGGRMAFNIDDIMVDEKDVQFVSGFTDEGKSVVVIKNKVYWFDADDASLTPMTANVDGKDEKVEINKETASALKDNPTGGVTLGVKYGDGQTGSLAFDHVLKPTKFELGDQLQNYTTVAPQESAPQGDLAVIGTSAPYRLSYKGQELKDATYQDAKIYGEKALVRTDNGKWGILEARLTPQFTYVANNGREVPFRHHTATTEMRIEMPTSFIPSQLAVEGDTLPGLTILPYTRVEKTTPQANYVIYSCELTMPEDLPTTPTDISYPLSITYAGAPMEGQALDIRGWRLNYFTVNPLSISSKGSDVTLVFDIDKHLASDDTDYPFEVTAKIGQATLTPKKISENRYRLNIPGLPYGKYQVAVEIGEKDCAPLSFPFDVEFTAPNPAADLAATVSIDITETVEAGELPAQNVYEAQAFQYPATPAYAPAPAYQQAAVQPQYQQAPAQPQYQQVPAQPQYQQVQAQPQYQQAPVQQQYQQTVAQPQYQQAPVQTQYQQAPAQQQYQQAPVQQQYQQAPAQQQYQQVQTQPQYQQAPVQTYVQAPAQQYQVAQTYNY